MMMDKFGKELTVDFKGSDFVDKEQVIRDFVDDLCKTIEMTKYGDLQLMFFGDTPEVAGYSFVQLIQESNISGHLCSYDYMMKDTEGNEYNNKGAGYLNIFSCKEFSTDKAVECVQRHFKPVSLVFSCHDRI